MSQLTPPQPPTAAPQAEPTPTMWQQPFPGPQGATGGGFPPQPWAAPQPRGNGLAIASLVVSVVALVGVLLIVLGLIGFGMAGSEAPGGWEPLRGSVAAGSGPLTAEALEEEVTATVEDDGGLVGQIECPSTPRVDQGVVTVCHATVDDAPWAIVVYFEDPEGTYTLGLL